ncbi:aldehyde:ferredoxin oxidoreductase [Desulfacinum infernum DSM 9756]|uniref:Aldehyde:ferredoxin oxidoreductase n=1 Tax=Desulfacinum infernum DSM 9756 TaxID=1121391 RepID=A0A1M5A553_9BACT|nr:aldehyde ferredoxin oxidoreductase family protein [Desulfacinum infernum]SHF25354.1 aldehyde:ferredoxin oxidoreductase [Desulfacinum infernum DSM 9756]
MNLYAGKILKVDLTHGTVTAEPLPGKWIRRYWGCWGLAVRLYTDLADPVVDPMAPENPLVIMTGPFCGTAVPLASRFCMVSKSPYTGTIFETNCGGAFGPELKYAGYDGLVITGASQRLVTLTIADGDVRLEDASDLAGKGIFETEAALKARPGLAEAKVLAIGPAGENRVGYACIGSEAYRQMGRAGGGALFGSKNLKAVVCRGTGGVAVADMPAFLAKVDHYKKTDLLTEDNLWAKTDGTPILVDVTNEMGIHPTRNFTHGVNEGKDAINSDAIKRNKVADRACASCPLGCGNYTRIKDAAVEGPEYETLCLAGSNCGMNDLEAVIRFNRLCDDLGLDTISAGNTIALAMDLTESGIHDYNLRFGEPDQYLQVLSEIAHLSTDRGRQLARGAWETAAAHGALDRVAASKKLEFPAYEPRGNYGMGVAYATSERGACHLRAFTIFSETPFDVEAMVRHVIADQNKNAIKWSMCFCDFWGTVSPEIMADLLTAGLGEPVTAEELTAAGERIWNLIRLFNVKAGFGSDQDTLPPKIFREPLKGGPHAGRVFSQEDFAKARALYYELRGWDENGMPTDEKLAQLELTRL